MRGVGRRRRRWHGAHTAVAGTRQIIRILLFGTLVIVVVIVLVIRASAATGATGHLSQCVLVSDAPHDHKGVSEVLVALTRPGMHTTTQSRKGQKMSNNCMNDITQISAWPHVFKDTK